MNMTNLLNVASSIRNVTLLCVCSLAIVGCSATGEEDSVPSSGSSGVGAPSSIISNKLVQRVIESGTDDNIDVVQPGASVEYNFIDSRTIQGAGLNTLPTTSWSYSSSGSRATVNLNYSVGRAVESLTFTSSTGGTYRSVSTLNSGSSGWHTGTFTVSGISGGGSTGGGSTGGGSTGGGSACSTNNTGEITIYTTKSTGGATSVKIDGASVGSLTSYFPSGAPTCGVSSSSGAITKTLTAGSHSIFAEDDEATWGPSNVTISQCGCLTYTLR